ncbi:type IV conjugative transfer system protein TraV, partial [Acinetobacter baumannii]|nr:type IV conjugative transfer system protein TraV [Acinetobacter baumannii]
KRQVNSQPNSKEILNGINTEIKDLNVDISKFTRQ